MFRYIPGDIFHYKRLMSDTVFMKSEFMREINEHKESFSGSEHRDYIDAYVAKMETEKNNEESSFSGKKYSHGSRETFLTLSTQNFILHRPEICDNV